MLPLVYSYLKQMNQITIYYTKSWSFRLNYIEVKLNKITATTVERERSKLCLLVLYQTLLLGPRGVLLVVDPWEQDGFRRCWSGTMRALVYAGRIFYVSLCPDVYLGF